MDLATAVTKLIASCVLENVNVKSFVSATGLYVLHQIVQEQIRLNLSELWQQKYSVAQTSTHEAICHCDVSRNLAPNLYTQSDLPCDLLQLHVTFCVLTLRVNIQLH